MINTFTVVEYNLHDLILHIIIIGLSFRTVHQNSSYARDSGKTVLVQRSVLSREELDTNITDFC